MEELLKKYYEYFLKLNHEDIKSFSRLYNLIINKYDIEKDSTLTREFQEYQKLFKTLDPLSSIRGNTMSLEVKKKRFARKKLSFDFFEAPEHLYTDFRGSFENGFIHTQTHSEKVFCKAYLSIKPEDYINSTLKLQEFISYLFQTYKEEDIGNCKFRKIPANDAVVLRLTSKNQLNDLIDFLDKNSEIRETFDLPNPFIPCLKGIGIITDDGKSYNKFITSALWNYMLDCKNNEKEVTPSGFIQFIQASDIKTPFTNEDVSTPEYKEVLLSKLMSISDKDIIERMLPQDEYENQSSKKY